MKPNLLTFRKQPAAALLFCLAMHLLASTAAWAAFKSDLEGQNAGSTNWANGPLLGWKELDLVPARVLFTGGPATNYVVALSFDHTKGGTTRGIEDLIGFTSSSNVIITAPPVLSAPSGVDIWTYTFTVTVTSAANGFVEYRARLSAGAHQFTGASLSMSLPGTGQLQISKPAAELGAPDLAIMKSGPSQASTNQIITYVIDYTNKLITADTAIGVQVTDILPPQVSYVANSANKGGKILGNTVTWDLGNLAPGKHGLLTYKVLVTNNIPVTTTFVNFAQIQSAQDDALPADNTASVTTTVTVLPSPVTYDDFYATGKNMPLTISAPGVLLNDSNALSAVLLIPPDFGTLTFNTNGSFIYVPDTNFLGTDSFAYRAVNSTNTSGPAVVSIDVTNTCFLVGATNITTNNTAGQCGAVVNFPPPTTTGDCAPIICTPASGSFFPVGTTTVTCTNSDGINTSFLITVLDTEVPAISCPSDLVLASDAGQCSRSNVTYIVSNSDNCPGATLVQTAGLPSGATFPTGPTTNSFVITDASGNSNSCSFTVTIDDGQGPSLTCPADLVLSADPGTCIATGVVLGSPTASDNCGAVTVTSNAPAQFPVGTNVVTWTATDISGNTTTCQQLVTVLEAIPPTITCPIDVTLLANFGPCSATNVPLGNPTTGDNCGVVLVTNDAPAVFPSGTNVVTWLVADASGNIATCQQSVTIIENPSLPPTIICPSDVIVNVDPGTCIATGVALGNASSFDNCVIVTTTNNAPAQFPSGTNFVTWIATDSNGNTNTCQQQVVVLESVPPTITCPADVVVNADPDSCFATGVVLGSPTVGDNCAVLNVTSNAPTQYPVGTNLVTWTVRDTSGNTNTCQQQVVVLDVQLPTITCPTDVTVNADLGVCFATGVALGSPTTSDNCGAVAVTSNAPAQFPVGTNVVTWTATDASGNSVTCQQSVVVRDIQLPTISCPADVMVNVNTGACFATGVALGSPTANDNCGAVAVTNNAPAQFPSGTNVVTWTATDASGNSATCQQQVIVLDAQVPTIACPADVTVNADSGTCFATGVVLGSPTASDNCGAVTVSSNAPAQFPVGTNLVTWTATDSNSNSATCQQQVIVLDSQVPTITCPADVTVNADTGTCLATGVALGSPTASDNCGAVTVSSNAPVQFPVGTNLVTWTVTDAIGNSTTCQQQVIVLDAQVPTITCPADVTVNADSGTCFATSVVLGSPTASDNCGAVTVSSNAPAQFPVGTNLVTWTATDSSGNSATCQQRVIVLDAQVPTIACAADVTVNADSGNCFATGVVLGSPTASDNCGAVTVSSNAPAQFPVGTNLVTWTATDSSGNTATCQQLVIVLDAQVPTIACAADVTVNADSGTCFATGVALGNPTASDNCGAVTVSSNAPAQFPVGTNVVTWTATDASGNSATCQQRVVVLDAQVPTIACAADVTVNVNAGTCFMTGVALGSPTASDNCGAVTVSSNAPAQFPVGTNVVTWTATDASGNSATCQQRVIVRDNQGPTINCPANLVVNASAGQCSSNVTFNVTANDACGSVTNLVSVPASGSAFPVGVTTVTNTATDNSGNTSQCTFTVTVIDTQLPTVTCSTNVTYNAPAGQTNLVVNFPAPTVTDNCPGATASCSPPAGSSFPLGVTIVTCTATDASGNTANCNFTVTVNPGNNAPVADNQNLSTPEDVPLPITLTGSDPDGNPLTFALISGPTNGVITGFNTNTGALTYTPSNNFNGSDAFTFRVNDGTTSSQPALVSITVTPVNDAPVANGQSVTTPEDTPLAITLTGSDIEGSPLTYAIASGPTNGAITGFNTNTGALTYTPSNNFNGSDAFTFRVNDGTTNSQPALVSITVTPVNDAPVANNDAYSLLKNTTLVIPAAGVLTNDTDTEGSALTAVLGSGTTHGSLVLNANGGFTYTPVSNYFGLDSFTYRANDGSSNSALATVTLTILATNTAPVANNDTYTTTEDVTLIIPAAGVLTNDVDVDGDALTALLVANVTHGTLSLNANGGFTYSPITNYNGSDSFTYRAADGQATGNVATVTINVAAMNDAPVANDQSVTTTENTPKAIVLTGSDTEGSPLTFNVATPPVNGTLSGLNTNTGAVAYTPNPGFTGSDSFTFWVNDGTNNSAPATVSISVTAQADVAVFKSGSTTGGAGAILTFTITATNAGPSTASNLVVFDQLPAAYTFVSGVPAPASVSGNLVAWPAFNLAGLGSSNFTMTVIPVSGGVFTNIAYATNSTPDPNPTNHNGSSTNSQVTTFVQPLADVAVLKSGSSSVPAGGTLVYTIVATNAGPLTATNVVVSDLLPVGATFQSASGTYVLTNGSVVWAAVDLPVGTSANYTLTVTAPPSGTLVNVASGTAVTPDPDPSNNNGSSTNSIVTTVVTSLADVALWKRGASNVVPGAQFSYSIAVTNFGPSPAADVQVTDLLPTNLTFVSASSGGVLSNGVVVWPAIGLLSVDAGTEFTLTVTAPLSGTVSNAAMAVSVTPDPNPTNSNGGGPGTHVATVTPFGVLQSANVLNPQTGLYEQRVTVTNTGGISVPALRVLVGNINGTNGVPRTNVFLYNATGTNGDGRPYVQYNETLLPGSNVTMVLEFYVPDRKPFTNSLEVIAVPASGTSTNAGPGVNIDRYFWDNRFTPARFVIEWTSVPGTSYTVLYSDDSPEGPWFVATPSVTANANRVQWYDDGPPKTASTPASAESRHYRVITNP